MTITTDDLPESLQKLLLEIQQTNMPLTITHKGKAIAIITPTQPKSRPPAGFMKDQGKILGDILSPIEQPWEVLQ